MPLRQIGKVAPKSLLFPVLCLVLLAACGSKAGTSPGASATATACAKTAQTATVFRVTSGILKSINKKTLVLTDTGGKSSTITYSSTTTFTREARIAASALKEGASVSVIVKSTGNAYTAVSVTAGGASGSFTNGGPPPSTNGAPVVINGGPGSPPSANGTAVTSINNEGGSGPCTAPTGGSKNTSSAIGNTNTHALIGTISQVNSTLLTITDYTGAPYTVTLTSQTQIIGTQKASAAALKVGEPLTVAGKSGSQNTISASTIEILLSLPDHS